MFNIEGAWGDDNTPPHKDAGYPDIGTFITEIKEINKSVSYDIEIEGEDFEIEKTFDFHGLILGEDVGKTLTKGMVNLGELIHNQISFQYILSLNKYNVGHGYDIDNNNKFFIFHEEDKINIDITQEENYLRGEFEFEPEEEMVITIEIDFMDKTIQAMVGEEVLNGSVNSSDSSIDPTEFNKDFYFGGINLGDNETSWEVEGKIYSLKTWKNDEVLSSILFYNGKAYDEENDETKNIIDAEWIEDEDADGGYITGSYKDSKIRSSFNRISKIKMIDTEIKYMDCFEDQEIAKPEEGTEIRWLINGHAYNGTDWIKSDISEGFKTDDLLDKEYEWELPNEEEFILTCGIKTEDESISPLIESATFEIIETRTNEAFGKTNEGWQKFPLVADSNTLKIAFNINKGLDLEMEQMELIPLGYFTLMPILQMHYLYKNKYFDDPIFLEKINNKLPNNIEVEDNFELKDLEDIRKMNHEELAEYLLKLFSFIAEPTPEAYFYTKAEEMGMSEELEIEDLEQYKIL